MKHTQESMLMSKFAVFIVPSMQSTTKISMVAMMMARKILDTLFMILWFMIVNVKVLWPEILGYFGQKRLKWLGECDIDHIIPTSPTK